MPLALLAIVAIVAIVGMVAAIVYALYRTARSEAKARSTYLRKKPKVTAPRALNL